MPPCPAHHFCIGAILGTYQSDRVTTVNFVNCHQPSIITLCQFFLPPKSWALLLFKSVLINKWPRNHFYVSITLIYRRWERHACCWVPQPKFECNPWPHPHHQSLCHGWLGLSSHGTWERVTGWASLHAVQGQPIAIYWLLQVVEYERACVVWWGCRKKKEDPLLGV